MELRDRPVRDLTAGSLSTVWAIEESPWPNRTSYVIARHERITAAANWNACVRLARGTFIKFLFQDDLLAPTCIERLVRCALAHPHIGLVFSPRDVIVSDQDASDPALQICVQ
jgi:hypothetical protein